GSRVERWSRSRGARPTWHPRVRRMVMTPNARVSMFVLVGLVALMASALPRGADAASAAEIRRDSLTALQNLYDKETAAKLLGEKAKGILVFPSIVKGGFVVGAQIGEGSLWKKGRVAGYYNSVAASYGLQAGLQTFGYALFFMNDAALQQLDDTHGFEIGVGARLVVVDAGPDRPTTT